MADSETPPKNDGKALRYALSGMAGVGAGTIAAAATVRREFDTDIGNVPDIKNVRNALKIALEGPGDEEYPKGKQDLHALFAEHGKSVVLPDEPAKKSLKGLPPLEKAKRRVQFFRDIRTWKNAAHGLEKDILEDLGYRSHGLTGITLGTLDRTRQMSMKSSSVIFLSSAVTLGLATAATYSFLNNNHANNKTVEANAKINELLDGLNVHEAEKSAGRG